MIYEKEIQLNTTLDKVKRFLLDYETYQDWQPTFRGYSVIKGRPGRTGFIGILNYKNNESVMQMKVTIDQNKLPEYLVETYEMDNVYNRCVNHFIEKDGKIIWQMAVFFELDESSNIHQDKFENGTLASMNAFKTFIENVI